jgi:hypothetical protein
VVRRSALRLPLWGAKTSWEAKTWPPVRSRQAFLESVKEDPDASRIAGMQFRVVIAGLAAVGASLFDIVDRKITTPVGDVGALKTARARHPHSASARATLRRLLQRQRQSA